MIQTVAAFTIPFGMTQVSQDICDQIKPLSGTHQFERTENFDILDTLPTVKVSLTDIVTSWINNVTLVPDQRWVMTTSWITENMTGHNMNYHVHQNSMFSAVLYFDKIVKEHPQLVFENPLPLMTSMQLTYGDNSFTSDFSAPIDTNLMLIFPSYIRHGHEKFKSQTNRRSLAMNFFPIGKIGFNDSILDINKLTYE